jgi:hypothetical protein
LTGGQRGAGRDREQERLGNQWLGVQATVIERAEQQRGVRMAVAYRLGLLADAAEQERDRQGRLLPGVRVEDPRQQAAVDICLESEPQARCGLPGAPGTPRGGGDRVECGPGIAEQDFPGGRERDPAGGAREELHTELALQVADRAGQRRLRHAEPLGRATEVQFLRHGDEIPQLPRLQFTHTPKVSVATGSVFQFPARPGFTGDSRVQGDEDSCTQSRYAKPVTRRN